MHPEAYEDTIGLDEEMKWMMKANDSGKLVHGATVDMNIFTFISTNVHREQPVREVIVIISQPCTLAENKTRNGENTQQSKNFKHKSDKRASIK